MAEFGRQEMVPGFKANSAFNTLGYPQYIFVAQLPATAYQAVGATSANSSTILGVLQNRPAIGEAMSIAQSGLSKVVAGGALNAGIFITANGSGRAAAVASGGMAAGRLLEAAVSDGDVVTAMLFHPVRWGQVL